MHNTQAARVQISPILQLLLRFSDFEEQLAIKLNTNMNRGNGKKDVKYEEA